MRIVNHKTVIPTRGAVVKASYKTHIGVRALMTLTRSNGQPVPFGATVTREEAQTQDSFIVGDGGDGTGGERQAERALGSGCGAAVPG